MKNPDKWVDRVCEGCKKPFQVRTCYLRRNHNVGRFCSNLCRRLRPEVAAISIHYRFKEQRDFRYKQYHKEVRLKALTFLCGGHPRCHRCGCDALPILEVNHLNGGGSVRKESGIKLWNYVLTLGESAKEYFNVLCKVCNQLDFVQRKFGYTQHKVAWDVSKKQRWIAVDFDGTLANFDCDWPADYTQVGEPIPAMVEQVKRWLQEGEDVRIFTARMDCYHPLFSDLTEEQVKKPVEDWCLRVFGQVLPITNKKDYWCKALYDDRAYHVVRNEGIIKMEEK
ncbi:MAG: hypothetical protein C5B59_08555 [Bacteroidetes bacterium]|nr:MAG: hypothetical protein C5B59_08555 [Bacteroidota bacterium]